MTSSHAPAIQPRAEVRARRRWLAFIVGIFVFQGVLWSGAIWLVSNDPSHAVVVDYDQRALAWDEHMQRVRQSSRLGWSAAFDVEGGQIRVRLVDAQQNPVDDAEVRLTLFHQARAAERTTLTLFADGEGNYTAAAPVRHAGKWRFELFARRGGDEFVLDHTQTLEAGDG